MNPDPATWSGWHNLTHPVLADPVWAFAGDFAPGQNFGIPAYTILNRELEIVSHGGGRNDNLVDALLAEPIPEVAWPLP